MNKPALTTALLVSLALASLFTSGCVVGDEEMECDASEESADCDESLGTSEDAIKGAGDRVLTPTNAPSPVGGAAATSTKCPPSSTRKKKRPDASSGATTSRATKA